MPTENRSSNTEMVSVPFHREDRYIVVKRSDLAKVPVAYRSALVDPLFHLQAHLPQRECLVIESDWPEYEPTWAAIKARVTGQAAPQSQAEPIAWMVGTAFWWTKDEAERDAAATGLPIIPVGPLSSSAEAGQLREVIKHSDEQIMRQSMRISNQRAQLAERDALLDRMYYYLSPALASHQYSMSEETMRDALSALHEWRQLRAGTEPSQDHVVEADEMVRLDEHVCKGAHELGNACGRCRRCIENALAR